MKVSSNVWMSCEIWGIETTENKKKEPKTTNNNKSRELWYVVCEYFMEFVNMVLTCLYEKPRPKTVCCRYVFSDDSGDFPKEICV